MDLADHKRRVEVQPRVQNKLTNHQLESLSSAHSVDRVSKTSQNAMPTGHRVCRRGSLLFVDRLAPTHYFLSTFD